MALVNAEIKAQGVSIQKQKLNAVMKKTQDIIDQMLPKQVAAVSFNVNEMFGKILMRKCGIGSFFNIDVWCCSGIPLQKNRHTF